MRTTRENTPNSRPSPMRRRSIIAAMVVVAAAGLAVIFQAVVAGAASGTDPVIFSYTGHVETWEVPAGVKSVTVVAKGAGGGAPAMLSGETVVSGGSGAEVKSVIAVTPGTKLSVLVGGPGAASLDGGAGGFGGGGNGGEGYNAVGGGRQWHKSHGRRTTGHGHRRRRWNGSRCRWGGRNERAGG